MAKRDSEEALEESKNYKDWLKNYGDYLIGFAYERIGDLPAAEDLAQDTFLAAWNSRKNFKGHSTFKTWLTAILKFKIINYHRKNRNEISLSELDGGSGNTNEDLLAKIAEGHPLLEAWQRCPDRECERKEAFNMFIHCSDSLPSRFKEVFMLSEVDGLTGKEISAKLDVSKANVWTLLHRAKKALVECMKHYRDLLRN